MSYLKVISKYRKLVSIALDGMLGFLQRKCLTLSLLDCSFVYIWLLYRVHPNKCSIICVISKNQIQADHQNEKMTGWQKQSPLFTYPRYIGWQKQSPLFTYPRYTG